MKKTYLSFGKAAKITSRRMGLSNFVNAAYRTDGDLEIKDAADLMKALTEMKADLEKQMEEKADKRFNEKIEAVNKAIEELKAVKPEVTKDELKAVKDDLETTIKAIDMLQIRFKSSAPAPKAPESKSFNEVLAETIEANLSQIKSFRSGQDLRFPFVGYDKKDGQGKYEEVKAVGDMSTSANFTGYANYTTDFRSNLIAEPYNNVWLSDVIPNEFSASGSSVMYPKENGGEGGAALWTDPTADKAQMDFDLTTQSAYYKWIAGYVIVAREMLDDIPFMLAYIQSRMLRSLKTAENDLILNGSSDTNPVSGIDDLATSYSGSFTDKIGKVLDAAYGQIVEDTNNFYNPTNVIMRPRQAVSIGLNQASGSGEYDLPQNSVAFSNGKLTIGGLQTVTTSQVGANDFYVFDRAALMFIRRMNPELRMFEDATLAKKNKVMFRIEERATLIGFNNSAIVKGTL